jgi:DNA-binding transcriptional LysR family regulator
MDRIDSVAIFTEVADRGSFAEAARRLNRSPAAVTRAVAELEARLGVRLLNRTTRAVSVTEPGQRFLAGARRVLADLAEIEQAAIGQGSAPRGELRLTAPIVFGRRHVLPLVTDFLAQFPEVSVRLSTVRSIWSRRDSTRRSASARWRSPRRSPRGSVRCVGSRSRRPAISSGAAG